MGASQSWATRSRGSARFTQIGPAVVPSARSTRQISEETPPASGGTRSGAPGPARSRKVLRVALGGKAHNAPGVAVARIEQPVMQPVGAALPELELGRQHAIAAPVRRPWRRIAVAPARLCHG